MAEELKLFGFWASPFSWRAEIALKMKGVKYEFVEENILVNKSALLLQYNPVHKKIPVLLHNGQPIAESMVIVQYADETWKDNPILPRDPYERAVARFWVKFLDEKCMPSLLKSFRSTGTEQQNAVEEACGFLKTLESELKNKKFFGGDTIGFADIAANFLGYWLGVVQEVVGAEILNADKFPLLCKWAEEFQNHPVIKKNLPPREKLRTALKARFEMK